MSNKIEKRIVKTTLISFLSTGISILFQIIMVPICLYYWGKDEFGAWLSVSAAFTLIRTIDSGYTTYVGNRLNILYHKNQYEMRKVLASAIWGILFLCILQVAILICLYYSNRFNLLVGDKQLSTGVNVVFILLMMTVIWMSTCAYIGILHRLLVPVGLMHQQLWWMLVLQVAQSVAIIIAAYCQMTIFSAALLFSISQSLVYITSGVYIRTQIPEFYPWVCGGDFKTAFDELKKSIPMSINGIVQQLGNSGLVVLVASVLGAAMVPVYSTMRTFSNLWTTVSNIVSAPLLPDVVRFHSTSEPHKLFQVNQVHLLLMGVVNLSLLLIYPLISFIYIFWTHHKLEFNHSLMSLLMASVALFSINSLFNVFLTGLNSSKYLVVSGIVRGALVLLVSELLMSSCGIAGIGWGVLAGEAVLMLLNDVIFMPLEMKKIGGGHLKIFTWRSYLSFSPVIIFMIATAIMKSISIIFYILSVAVTIFGLYFSWENLNSNLKLRILQTLRLKKDTV